MALLDVIVASVVLLVVLVPAAQLLMSSSKVVGASTSQATAQSLAASQIGSDRAAAWSASAPPTWSSSCGSKTLTTYGASLVSCPTVGGKPYWVFQNAGWCTTSSGTLSTVPSTTVAGTIPYYWVEVVVAWGGTQAPTTVTTGTSVVMTSALQTPVGYTGSVTAGCPL